MFKLRIVFIISLVLVSGLLVLAAIFVPRLHKDTGVKRFQIAEADAGWILQCDIVNSQASDTKYQLIVRVDQSEHRDSFTVAAGKVYTYIFHIPQAEVKEGKVTLLLYQEGKAAPVDEVTYFLKPAAR